jgi:zinc protease
MTNQPKVLTVASTGPLLHVKVMVKAGSAQDPKGHEGLATLTGQLLVEGGYVAGGEKISKEQLGDMCRPWGEGAYPSVSVGRENITYSMTIPRERLAEYCLRILQPMFAQPQFDEAELLRLRREYLEHITSTLRFQQIEMLGLLALDNSIHDGTSYAHLTEGTVQGLGRVTRRAVRRYYRTHFRAGNITVGVSSQDAEIVQRLVEALSGAGGSAADVEALPPRPLRAPKPIAGRQLTLIGMPNAIATGIHIGFPIGVTRADADYWPLFVANVWFGTHRDSFSHLYQVIREERGYNYGDYSYIEHFAGRPYFLFPPTNTPRRFQYFSIWIRPVANEYAHHLMKAATYELEMFLKNGLADEEVEAAKHQARVLYLSYAENIDRWVGYKVDDDFYGLQEGYLEEYLARIDAVTPDAANRAIRAHLQSENVKYVMVTDQGLAAKLADDIANSRPASGKGPQEYRLDSLEREGMKHWLLSDDRIAMLKTDALWEAYPLEIPASRIWIIKAEQMFETAGMPK